jgi:hypothetical protein
MVSLGSKAAQPRRAGAGRVGQTQKNRRGFRVGEAAQTALWDFGFRCYPLVVSIRPRAFRYKLWESPFSGGVR